MNNKPGVYPAIHIEYGDYVKIDNEILFIEETDYDDCLVTLWFSTGIPRQFEHRKKIEVVATPAQEGE